jgi:hypothetical protein
MQTNPRSIVEQAAREMLSALAECPIAPTLRVVDAEGRVACLILVWDSMKAMPTIRVERRQQSGSRADCKTHILEVLRQSNSPLTRKEVLRELRKMGKNHGAGTVAKALADLTATGTLVNLKDTKGYRMPEWIRRQKTVGLFD